MSKRTLILAPIVILISAAIALSGIFLFKQSTALKKAHYHAGFQIYVDGKLQDYSNDKYMKATPCAVGDSKEILTPEEEQLDKAHLHDNVGQVVHAHLKPAYWRDLFVNMRYTFPTNKPVRSFVNGKEVKNILNYPIQPYDSIIILIGKNNSINDYLNKSVTKEQILKIEEKSENCGS